MPKIRSSADLRNNYNEISTFCHEYAEPVFITKNGKGDLVVISNAEYERLTSYTELFFNVKKGIDDMNEGKGRPAKEVFKDLEESFGFDV